MEKTYNAAEVEAKHYARWERSGAFACGHSRPDGPAAGAAPYTIVIPPPNVTGSLHMGHALNNTLQDILIRFMRMRGRDALWQPGTDHAGIATQIVVERQLAEDGIRLDRGRGAHDKNTTLIGREEFLEKVWAWKKESGGAITGQLRRLGASCDWSRERFTMDDGLSQAVRRVFVSLYRDALIYRDKRLVNWDPVLHTAVSDLEVEQREVKGRLWYFRYPIEGRDSEFITIATTRPETMLGDTAVAVHPDDERYTDLIGCHVILPLVGRRIPVIADEHSDPEKGSGAVKITPAHDFNDFEVGRRHELPMVSIFDQSGRLNDAAPERFRGLDRFEVREQVVEAMDALGLLEKIEDNPMTVPYGDRSGVVIEPRLTDQWFVDAAKLAGPAIRAVEQGATRFVPRHWENTYYEWMRNIQPWCISRQIWWGHQIPAWYGPLMLPDETIDSTKFFGSRCFVALDEQEALAQAREHYRSRLGEVDIEICRDFDEVGESIRNVTSGRSNIIKIVRDPDVLDTWFSSALWPFSTLGWPDETPELARYYPTDVLVTGFDIIFFWVARMMMMGLHFMNEAPFHTVYIHALVRDARGQKMSKSKGNVMDPLDLIDKYGGDALRFTLTALAAQGRDIKLAAGRIEGYRNFVTKLWNAARYAEMNGCAPVAGFEPSRCRLTVNRWIVGEVAAAERQVRTALEDYRFNDAANALYRFTWHGFCDWYLEFTKPILAGDDAAAQAETRAATAWVLDQLLHLLHPIMPFVTEELWEALAPAGAARPGPLMTSAWPSPGDGLEHAASKSEMDWVVRVISEIRAVRSELNVPPGAKFPLLVKDAGDAARRRLETHRELILRLARLAEIGLIDGAAPRGAVQIVVDEATLCLPLGDVIDVDREKARLAREIDRIDGEIGRIDRKLANESFISRAPAEVVAENRDKRSDYELSRTRLCEALQRIAVM